MNFETGIGHLTDIFRDMLNCAEDQFGERDKSWTYIGLEFRDDGPYILYYPRKQVAIVLSTSCSEFIPEHPQLYYQLAHEVCHLLHPTGRADANVLVEGISTYFSKIYLETIFPGSEYALKNIRKSKYFRAYQLVEKLLSNDPDSIKKIKGAFPNISSLTEKDLKSFGFQLSVVEVKELIQKF